MTEDTARPTPTRNDVAKIFNLSREMGLARRCINELMALNIYRYDTKEWALVEDCRDMLEDKIKELFCERR
ncbi:hypothetical protein PED39_05335 [Methanomassiliicoccales archaeon LGM-RCC1]|nr:hypothetical protein PED39_05335 [Methanomassiliicoccales archaeon LGM-RCC1]